jgi:hypothetical protein
MTKAQRWQFFWTIAFLSGKRRVSLRLETVKTNAIQLLTVLGSFIVLTLTVVCVCSRHNGCYREFHQWKLRTIQRAPCPRG